MVTNDYDACSQLCRRYELELLSFSPRTFSRYVARVRDESGRVLLLKQASSAQQGASEAEALRAWQDTNVAAQLVRELEGGAFLAEWLDGIPLSEVPAAEPVDFVAVGRMLSAIHNVTAPRTGSGIRDRLTPSPGEAWLALSPELRALADTSAESLRDFEPLQPVLLHGDLVPTNVMLTNTGPKVIDPEPRVGPAAWDIAQLAAAAAGRGRQLAIGPLLEGYGAEPSLLGEMYAWMVLWFYQRNLAAGREEFSRNLQPLTEELLDAGNPERFLRGHLTP